MYFTVVFFNPKSNHSLKSRDNQITPSVSFISSVFVCLFLVKAARGPKCACSVIPWTQQYSWLQSLPWKEAPGRSAQGLLVGRQRLNGKQKCLRCSLNPCPFPHTGSWPQRYTLACAPQEVFSQNQYSSCSGMEVAAEEQPNGRDLGLMPAAPRHCLLPEPGS